MESRDHMLMRARELRQNMTLEEKTLWYQFLRKHPLHWYRQRVIGEYIVDFYCHAAGLVVEVDGSQHEEIDGWYADQVRDRALGELGLRVLRFSNLDVRYHLRRVCEAINEESQAARAGVITEKPPERPFRSLREP